MEHERNGYTNCNWCIRNDPERIGKGTERLGNKMTSREHSDYCITKISQNTEKSPGDFRSIVVTQTPVKNYQLKILKE